MAAVMIAVMGWFVSPIIRSLLPKILSCLGFDPSKKLRELEIRIIPELKKTLRAVDQERMMQRKDKEKSDVEALDKMTAMLRHAREETEDIFDDQQEIELYRNRLLQRLYHAFATCIARLKRRITGFIRRKAHIIRRKSARWARKISLLWSEDVSTCIALFNRSCMWIARVIQSGPARLLQWARKIFLHGSEDVLPVTTSAAALDGPALVATNGATSDESSPVTTSSTVLDGLIPVATNAAASDELTVPATTSSAVSDGPVPVATNAAASDELTVPVTTPSESSGGRLSCWSSSFDFFKNCCRSIFHWLAHAIEAAQTYRDWSYEVVGIAGHQENVSVLDFVLTAISRRNLKKRIENVESTVSEVKESPLLGIASKIAPNDIANKNRSQVGTDSNRKVFGREELRDDIMAKLRETPHSDAPCSSISRCYSVIGIYGISGSGKTTFAQYLQDYIKKGCEEKLFDTVMCIHVSETFSVDDIFREMLKDIIEDSHSNISNCADLKSKLKKALRGKRFFLILDDLWVKNKNDPQLEELIYPLNVGLKGSKILVTARTKDAAGALCANELIKMPGLDEDQYLKMFMHYALDGTGFAHEEFMSVGREIAKKLHRSPIAAVTVAGRLGANPNISFWKNVAKLDMLNDTMDALWWSYQQLNPDIRRCFEFCNIFPRRSKLKKDQLVCLWIAQGFVKTSCATEEKEDVAEGYIQELVSCSFLQPKGTSSNTDCFTIHDLLHDLANKVAGSDCFRIENERGQRGEGWKGDVPRDVRHLFVEKYNAELITEKVLGLKNLRTLIIYVVEKYTPVEEKVLESICMRLPKLRVLAIDFNLKFPIGNPREKFLVPESIIQLKHLRYLAFPKSFRCKVILPCALAKLLHIQLLDFGNGIISEFTFADLINLRHISCLGVKFPNIGRLSSLQTIPCFRVRNEQGYEIKQLRDLNKLRGSLLINGLENVKSKEEALEANLAAKERLTELRLRFYRFNEWRNAEVEAKVLEGLCPPFGLETLNIKGYKGSRYPDWMVGELNGGPKDLQELELQFWSQLGPGPELGAFPHIRVLCLAFCSWDALPGKMEHLTSLEILRIRGCMNIRSLPTLPQSLEGFDLSSCDDELMKGCQTEGDPNWLKIMHIPVKIFYPRITSSTSQEGPSHASEAL